MGDVRGNSGRLHPFNRTSLELKHIQRLDICRQRFTFNRTSLELKRASLAQSAGSIGF